MPIPSASDPDPSGFQIFLNPTYVYMASFPPNLFITGELEISHGMIRYDFKN